MQNSSSEKHYIKFINGDMYYFNISNINKALKMLHDDIFNDEREK